MESHMGKRLTNYTLIDLLFSRFDLMRYSSHSVQIANLFLLIGR
jgi:hypothetical protein